MAALGGIKSMRKAPDALFIIDTRKEEIAVKEATKLGIAVIAPVDTNCDPDVISHKVPGNDDAIRAIRLFTNAIAESILEGKAIYEERQQGEGNKEEPVATVAAAPSEEAEEALMSSEEGGVA
jgi:small subunit ribosomal protein S2